MAPSDYTEDTLVQQNTAEYLESVLGWDSVYAYNNETFGPDAAMEAENRCAVGILARLKTEKLRIEHWRDKEATRDAVRVTIQDHLWIDGTGLPIDTYTEEDVNGKAEEVFRHVYRAYPELPSPFYASGSVAG